MFADDARDPLSDDGPRSHGRALTVLAVVAVIGAALRLPGLTSAPPGLNQDEACNAWNAWCLLKTGRDQWGEPWPVFCMRAMGEYRSTLYAYVLIPFQAVGGLNVWTTRLPAALAGVATIVVLYALAARLFGRGVGLATAALLAINPTHIQMSRWGHEGSLTPLLSALPLLALVWAGLPPSESQSPPRAWRTALAGLVAGLVCYGYPAVRLFVPALFAGLVLVTGRQWRTLLRGRSRPRGTEREGEPPGEPRLGRSHALPSGRSADAHSATRCGAVAVGIWLVTFVAAFGPLAYKHITEPERIGRRGWMTRLWEPTDGAATRVQRVVVRYAAHFGPHFLFIRGDVDEIAWSAGMGFMPWYSLPLLAVGLVVGVRRWRDSPAARVLLVAVALYPAADCLNWHHSLHALRSSAGLWALVLLAAVGLTGAARALVRRGLLGWTTAAAAAWGGPAAWETGAFLYPYFAARPQQTTVYHGHHVDLMEVCAWLRPRVDAADVILCTEADFNKPYLVVLVALQYDPARWFAEPREYVPDGAWDRCVRVGKFRFLRAAERAAPLAALRDNGRDDRVFLILRPREHALGTPVMEVARPDGEVVLTVWEVSL
ncbi:MAG: glycosyltransferase family 39 protein [Planctomycetota bacterium]